MLSFSLALLLHLWFNVLSYLRRFEHIAVCRWFCAILLLLVLGLLRCCTLVLVFQVKYYS
jgi:hypothetical protein